MSEQAAEGPTLDVPPQGDVAFADLMAVLAPEESGAPAATGTAEAGGDGAAAAGAAGEGGQGAAGAAGEAAPAGAPAEAGAPKPGDPAVGTGGADAGPAGGEQSAAEPGADAADGTAEADSGAAAGRPADWTATADALLPKIGELSTAYEEKTAAAYQAKALGEAREQFTKYFEALEEHPRALVGRAVPRLDGKEGTETLSTTEDAREWQDQLKHVLVAEIRGRATKAMEEDATTLNTVHASIELFQNNKDLIPRTKDFDVELANRFASYAQPYELRVDGKLHGYSIPVQGMIDKIREDLVKERAARTVASSVTEQKAVPAAGAPAPSLGAPAAPKADEQPQAGIQSKAGSGEQQEDFSTLFGTIGLPNLRI